MNTLTRILQSLNPLGVVARLQPARGRLLMLGLAVGLMVLLTTLFGNGLNTLEERLGAQGWVLAPDASPEQRITIVTIDEASLAEIGPWPWSREQMARLVEGLNEQGVQLQLHDISYPEMRSGDESLLAALDASRGAVLAQLPLLHNDQQVRTGVMTHPVSGVSCEAGAAGSTDSFVANHAGFASIAKGHIASIVASDGSLRKVPAFTCVDGVPYPSLAISALLQATNADTWSVTLEEGAGLFSAPRSLQLDAYPGLEIPLDSDNNMRISYRQDPSVFQAVSAADVIYDRIPQGMLANGWVLIGGTAFGMGDIVPTPFNGSAPGVEIQARLLTSILDAQIPYTPSAAPAMQWAVILLFAFVLFWLASARERMAAYGLPVMGLLLPILVMGLHWQLLITQQVWIGWLNPALFAILGAGLLLLLEQHRVRAERTRVFSNLNSYLPSDVARDIAFSLPSSSINAKRCDVTLMCADLRNFAAFGEARPAEESAAILHFFFMRTAEIVETHGGRIHEFKGDSVLAVWDGQDASAARKALQAAQELQENIQLDLPNHAPASLEPLALGIGIEQGPALVGSIGPAQRRTHTLLGDTVTITLRIQEMTAELAQPILLGECAGRQLSDLKLESQGSYLLNGLRIPHTLYAPANCPAPVKSRHSGKSRLKVVSGGRA